MRQRLGIASAMIGDPKVLILDEPANGLDPEGIRWMREFLRAFAAQGRTVFVSSHLLSEMELLADDVIIIAAGKLIAQGRVDEIVGGMSHAGDGPGAHAAGRRAHRGAAASWAPSVNANGNGALQVTGVDAPAVGPRGAGRARSSCTSWSTSGPTSSTCSCELTQGKAGIR